MSRSLTLIAVLILALTGCALLPSQQASREASLAAYAALKAWLDRVQSVEAMSRKRVTARLSDMGKPKDHDELFYFGLLSQRSNAYDSWTQARDAFRELSEAPAITREQRQLASILLLYNQSRINAHLRSRKVKADCSATETDLEQVRSENDLLERKIQAITDLETSISTRKEQ